MITCKQKGDGGCTREAAFRFTWPGQDESYVCAVHAPKLRGIAAVMGMHLQLIMLNPEDRARSDQSAPAARKDDS